jgi:hypothetical protein
MGNKWGAAWSGIGARRGFFNGKRSASCGSERELGRQVRALSWNSGATFGFDWERGRQVRLRAGTGMAGPASVGTGAQSGRVAIWETTCAQLREKWGVEKRVCSEVGGCWVPEG